MRKKIKQMSILGGDCPAARLLLVSVLFIASGPNCSRANDGYIPLPDYSSDYYPAEYAGMFLEGAREHCEAGIRGEQGIAEVSADAVLMGQFRMALHYLEDERRFATAPPIPLIARVGLVPDGRSAFGIWIINPNRETIKIHVLMRGPEDMFVPMVLDLLLEVKEFEYLTYKFFPVRILAWDELRKLAAMQEEGVIRVAFDPGNAEFADPIPFPDISVISVSTAVEDRNGRLSGYVPVYHYDAAPLSTISDPKVDIEGVSGRNEVDREP